MEQRWAGTLDGWRPVQRMEQRWAGTDDGRRLVQGMEQRIRIDNGDRPAGGMEQTGNDNGRKSERRMGPEITERYSREEVRESERIAFVQKG